MQILFLTQIIPWPPDAGPKVKTWQVLQYLKGEGHQVHLASFVRPEEEQHVQALASVCASVHTVPIRRSTAANLGYYLKSLWSGRPFLIERDDLHGMRRLVRSILAEREIDLIHADQLSMVQFAFSSAYPLDALGAVAHAGKRRPFLVFDAHNATWTIMERMRETMAWYLRPVLSLEARRIRRYEGEIVRSFDHTFAVAEPDAAALREAAGSLPGKLDTSGSRISVIPIGVDTSRLHPAKRRPNSMNILTLGTLHYPPNADGVRWFAREVFPLVREQLPTACLTIVGKNPPSDFMQMAAEDPQHMTVTGYVPDLEPYFEQAAVVVVPVRAGGGMRVRILEAFARGMPAVTTTVGLEGIEAEPGKEIFVEDTPRDFAASVIKVLGDADLQARLAENGRRLAETRYDFRVVLQELGRVYASLEGEPV